MEKYYYKQIHSRVQSTESFFQNFLVKILWKKNSITTIAQPSDNLFPQKLEIYFVSESLNDIWSPGLKIDFRFTFDKSRIKWNRSFQKPRKKTSVRYRVVNAKRWRKKEFVRVNIWGRGFISTSPKTLALLSKTYASHFRRYFLASLAGAGVQGGSAPL